MEKLINAVKVNDDTVFEYRINPKSTNFMAGRRYELYQEATTLKEYEDICGEHDFKQANADLKYDESRGFLKLYDQEGERLPGFTEVEAK